MKILYLTPGCFDKGGISRYSRYQISALSEIFGSESLRVLSLLGKTKDSFESEFEVTWSAQGITFSDKLRFIVYALSQTTIWRPNAIHTAHVNLSGLSLVLARLCKATTMLNTYGLEVWSGLSLDANYGLRHTDHVISDCHYTARYLEAQGLRSKNSTEVIWDCVDLARFSPGSPSSAILSKYGIPDPEKHFILLTLGRLSRSASHKGYERLLKVFAEVVHDHPRTRLVIAGQGDMATVLKEHSKDLQVEDKVVFTGPIAENDLVDVYRAAHVFSLVSDRGAGRGEGIPLAVLEAMASGVPVVVGNQDGSQEAVQKGINGYVLDPFDLQSHVKVIKLLICDEGLRSQFSTGALRLARNHFSYEDFREKHRVLYNRIMNFAGD